MATAAVVLSVAKLFSMAMTAAAAAADLFFSKTMQKVHNAKYTYLTQRPAFTRDNSNILHQQFCNDAGIPITQLRDEGPRHSQHLII